MVPFMTVLQTTPRRQNSRVSFSLIIYLSILAGSCLAATTTISNQQQLAQQEDTLSSNDEEHYCPDFAAVDDVEDSLFDPIQADFDSKGQEYLHPPLSTLEAEIVSAMELGDPVTYHEEIDKGTRQEHNNASNAKLVADQHWGFDPEVLRMRDALRRSEANRPPIFLVPGLAASRLVAWRHKECRHKPLMSDIRVQDYVWLNLNLIMQMGTIDDRCFMECIKLGLNQTDSLDGGGCKLRPDEGLDAISSLSVGGIQSHLLMGRTNTVYSWLIQWLSDNLGYDVGSIIGFPYDWRLSPGKLEERDGFLTYMRRRIELAVETIGEPGILVAHSMGNLVFRYFLSWLRVEFAEEVYLESSSDNDTPRFASSHRTQGRPRRPDKPGWMMKMEREHENATRWKAAKREGDKRWHDWIESHIWTYVGLSAPHIGAVNPLRAAISGETMGLPVAEETVREIELSFGSTLTVSPISSQVAFCDEFDFRVWDEAPVRAIETNSSQRRRQHHQQPRLACLDDVAIEIQNHSNETRDPWHGYDALKALLVDRVDWDTDFPMIAAIREDCDSIVGSFCLKKVDKLGPHDVQNGLVFRYFSQIWKEDGDPLYVKYEQLRESFWKGPVPNILSEVWERPPIKHVIMAYGTDTPTEVGYAYLKREDRRENVCKKAGIPNLHSVIVETKGGKILKERLDVPKGIFSPKKPKRQYMRKGSLQHSGDGSVPYLSLSFAHLWLLYGFRILMADGKIPTSQNPLETIQASYRPKGGMEWIQGIPDSVDTSTTTTDDGPDSFDSSSDTGTLHPHGTRYKPLMHRFHSTFVTTNTFEEGDSAATTGMEYTTTVIEASGVEHKETTRNYDILAAVFTDVLKAMHCDFDVPR